MPQNLKKKAKAKEVKKTVAVKKSAKPATKRVESKKPVAKKTAVKHVAAKKAAPQKAVAHKPTVKAQAPKKAVVAKQAEVTKVAVKPQAQKPEAKAAAKTAAPTAKVAYKVGHHVVYPTHGVGKIVAEETQMIGDIELRMLVIAFEKDKMTLRVPVSRATAAGLRPVSSADQIKKVFVTLKSRARTSRGMWSRRAQEYEAKINSGNIFSIAEVVRDLHQNVDQSERSYSERMIYESALARLVGELAASEASDHKTATDKLMKLLRGKVAAAAALKEAA